MERIVGAGQGAVIRQIAGGIILPANHLVGGIVGRLGDHRPVPGGRQAMARQVIGIRT